MNGFAPHAVLNIDDISKDLEQFPEEFRVVGYGSGVDGGAVVGALVVLDEAELFELVYDREIAN